MNYDEKVKITCGEIAKEGWSFDIKEGKEFGGRHYSESSHSGFAKRLRHEKGPDYDLYLQYNGMLQIRRTSYYEGNTFLTEHIYDGTCYTIEDFRTIIRLLGI